MTGARAIPPEGLAPLLEAVPEAAVSRTFGDLTVDVPAEGWHEAVLAARDGLDCSFLDFLSAVDEGDGVRVVCHVVRLRPFGHLVLRALLAGETPRIASVQDVYAGAAWHERECAEMFGVAFTGPRGEPLDLPHLLLEDGFAGHPLRKDFPLPARVETPWPGEVEPR